MVLEEKESWTSYKLHLIMILKLSWPNILTSLISLAIPVTSTLAVGHIKGKTDLIGAAALGNMFANATGNAVGVGLSMALDTLCSQAFGAKKYKLVGLHCQRAMVILTIACIPIAILWYNAWILLQFIGDEQTAALSLYWVHRLIPSLWPRVIYESYRRYLLSQRIMWPVTVSVAFTVPFHIMNTYLFVYHFDFGFAGAAYATSISFWILFLTVFVVSNIRSYFLRRKAALSQQGTPYSSPFLLSPKQHMRINTEEDSVDTDSLNSSVGSSVGLMESSDEIDNRDVYLDSEDGDPLHTWPDLSKDIFKGWISFLRLGVATTLSVVIEWGSFEVNAAIASRLGVTQLAAHAIMCNSVSIWYSVPMGVATAATTLVGNMLGSGEPERAKLVSRLAFMLAICYGVLNGALGLLYRDFLGRAFTEDEAVVKAISATMLVLWIYGLVDAVKAVGMAVLRGSGRPKITVYGNILSCLMVGYPVAMLLVFKAHLGLDGLWFGMSTAWFCASAIYGIIISRTNWNQEVLNAAKRNDEAANSTTKGQELAKQGLLMSVVVKGPKNLVAEEDAFSIGTEENEEISDSAAILKESAKQAV